MTIFQAIVLGLVQGLTEFLPVSSSAHLALTPWLLGWEEHGLAFDVALHLGSLVAVAWYFRRDWFELLRATGSLLRTRRADTIETRRLVYLIAATIPAGIAGVLLQDYAETVFRHPAVTAIALIVLGVLLWAVDTWAARARSLDTLRARDAWLIGFAQCLALVPGVSRSGATMTAARALGLDRAAAARFSFLMSFPIIGAAIVFKAPDLLAGDTPAAAIVAGVLAAAVSAWLAITVLLRWLTTRGFGVFAAYRVVLGAIVLWRVLQGGGPA